MSKNSLIRAIFRWAKDDAQRKAKLEVWLDEGISALADGKGAHISSASMNSVFFTSITSSMTVDQWVSILSQVLLLLDEGKAPSPGYQQYRFY